MSTKMLYTANKGPVKALAGKLNEISPEDKNKYLDKLKGTSSHEDKSQPSLEKLINKNNLTNVSWLSRGVELSRAVCRVVTPSGRGTGFLINGDLMITNNHVISSLEEVAASAAEFNYQIDWNSRPQKAIQYSFDPDPTTFKTSTHLDYTVVKVKGEPSREFGSINVGVRARPRPEDYVTIIQHPQGGYKQIALTENSVFAVFDHLVQYITDTLPGSSGSPVFDQEWRLVGLHHAGGDLPGPDGKTSFINEGILIDSIVQDAGILLGSSDEVFELVIGPLYPSLTWLASSSGAKQDLLDAGRMISVTNRDFATKLSSRVAAAELGPLGAAIVGVAAGAVIRHIGKQNEVMEQQSEIQIDDDSRSAISKVVLEAKQGGDKTSWDIYTAILDNSSGIQDNYSSIAESRDEVFPVVVSAFLTGVVVGSKAYDGKL